MRKGVKEFALSHCDIRPFAPPTPLQPRSHIFPQIRRLMVSTMLLRPISSSSQQVYYKFITFVFFRFSLQKIKK